MIREIQIENYKSLQELKLEVGRFNVLIGENGCGKSNLLEAMALAAAAESGKLDNEFLTSRGIRVSEPKLMRSCFDQERQFDPIEINIKLSDFDFLKEYILINENPPYSKWTRLGGEALYDLPKLWMQIIELGSKNENIIPELKVSDLKEKIFHHALKYFKGSEQDIKKFLERNEGVINNENKIKNFIIFSPENTALRNFYKEGQIEPLGINGEGLLKLLSVIKNQAAASGDTSKLDEIHQSLQLLDWYSDIEIPSDLSVSEDKVKIKDRYLTAAFDQRSANEGFLFILFYITLMVADETPKIFAIDNIDASLNPKLCTQLIKELIRLAEKYDKQVFVTGHNPAILDGIDLGDDEQRLFVLFRNKQGHTRCKRITLQDKPKSSTGEPLKLSEAFLRGYLGGLPKGF
ncbi:MAG: AAA family ATPase [Gammaproteobacteria bacterium]